MEIKRKTEILVETSRRFVIHQPDSYALSVCHECSEPMLAAEQAAGVLGISQRRIFQLLETGSVHFAETDAGLVMFCPTSLASFLDEGSKRLPAVSE